MMRYQSNVSNLNEYSNSKKELMYLKKVTKNQKQKPIEKILIKNSKYYIPYFTNEKDWLIISIPNIEWFNILYYNYKINLKVENKKICSIDIGCKNFISLYGLDGYCYKIKSDYIIIDNLLKNNSISYKEKDKKIKSLIEKMHIISANFICSKYDTIFVGLVNNSGKIDSETMNSIEDNLLKIVSHKEFLEILKIYANKLNKKLHIVEESYTSVQCGICGEKNKFTRIFNKDDSERRKYTCKYCHGEFCRDLNASRNILIKNEQFFNFS